MQYRIGYYLLILFLTGCTNGADDSHTPSDKSASPDDDGKGDGDGEEPAGSDEDTLVYDNAERAPCNLDTGWRGDDQCIMPPDPKSGFQLHFGPADYDDPDEVARYTLAPNAEAMLCTYIVTPNDQEIFYDDWQNKLRPGSHHMIVNQVGAGEEMAGVPCSAADGAGSQGIVAGNTTTVMPLADIAPENVGIARTLPPHARIVMQLHFFNTTEEPLLMEAWQNIYYKNPDDVTAVSAPLESIAGLGMSVEPGTTEVIRGSLIAPGALRVLALYSHHHDHTLRFSTYLRRKDSADRTQIYESYDWEHPLLLPLDSQHENPVFDRKLKSAGGMTGALEISEGDTLEFECEIQNNDLDEPLYFANEAHTAEMCILRGFYTPGAASAWSSFSL